jgi:putative hydrolase of the HAD superfamily
MLENEWNTETRMTRGLSTVFFDAGDTLFRLKSPLHVLYGGVINEVVGDRFAEEEVHDAMRMTGERLPLVLEGHFRYSDPWFERYIEILLDHLNCPRPWKGIREGLFRLFDDPGTFRVFPDVRPCLRAIQDLGLKTAVVSNWGYRLPRLLDRLGLADAFGAILASADVESEKPDGRIFQRALEAVEADPLEAIHVGDDTINDVEGARTAGLRSVLLDRDALHPDRRDRISSLEDLPGYIQNHHEDDRLQKI